MGSARRLVWFAGPSGQKTGIDRHQGNDMHRSMGLFTLSIVAALAVLTGPLHAADWPTRPVTVIVPFGAGGNTDMMARLARATSDRQIRPDLRG